MSISSILTPFDHFHFCPTLGLTWLRKLTVCHKQRWSHQRWFEGGRRCRLDIACVSRGRQLGGRRRGGVGGILELPTAFYPGLPRPTVLLSQLPVSRINFLLSFNIHTIREGFKNPNHGFLPWWGGGTPLCRDFFSVTFLAGRLPWWGGGGYPPLPWLKNLLKIGPKTVFFRQKTPFLAKISKPLAVMGGEGVPPFAVIFFPLIFWLAACRDGGRGGGGYPHHSKKPWLGFLNPSLSFEYYIFGGKNIELVFL